jgi:hypothetical protein
MYAFYRRLQGQQQQQQHKYAPIREPRHDEGFRDTTPPRSVNIWTKKRILLLMMIGTLVGLVGVLGVGYVIAGLLLVNECKLFV